MSSAKTHIRNYSNGMLRKSKKINKMIERKPLKTDISNNNIQNSSIKIKKGNAKIFIPVLESLEIFLHEETNQFLKIKERTNKMIHFEKELIKKAVSSLKNYAQKGLSMNENFQENVILEITFDKKFPKTLIKSMKISLPHIKMSSDLKFCFVVKNVQVFEEKIKNSKYKNNITVLEYTKKGFLANQSLDMKKKFLNKTEQIFCDFSLYNLLMKKEGKLFYKLKKIPYPFNCDQVPLNIKEKNYELYLKDLIESSYLRITESSKQIIKIANIDMSFKEIINNIVNGSPYAISLILKNSEKHTKLSQISVKYGNSIPLPIWNSISEEQENIDLLNS